MKKNELKELIKMDKKNYLNSSLVHRLYEIFTKNSQYIYMKIIITARKYYYYKNKRNFLTIFYKRKLNILSQKYNINISGKFGKNLKIFHENITINQYAIIGDNVKFHGNNCVGNNGKDWYNCPKIGNNVDIGYGATIIGDITIADNCIIGANTLVNKSIINPGSVVVGNPGRIIK